MDDSSEQFALAMRAARKLLQGRRAEEGFACYDRILAEARAKGDLDHVVQAQLDYGVQLLACERVEEGADRINDAAFIVVEANLAERHGDLSLAFGELCSAREERADAIEWFLEAARTFMQTGRTLEFALALSHYASEVDSAGNPRDALSAHEKAAEAAQLVEGMPVPAMRLAAMHLECVGRRYRDLNKPVDALGAFDAASDYWQLSGAVLDAARCDVVMGSIYLKLDCQDAAERHVRTALRRFREGGDVDSAARMSSYLRRFAEDQRDTGIDFG